VDQKVEVSLNNAEVRALRQIHQHGGTLNGFERDLLEQILRKIDRPVDQTWRRFVWTAEDVTVLHLSQGGEPPGPASPDEHAVRFADFDELMEEIDLVIGNEG
jgi:hypothetical protein